MLILLLFGCSKESAIGSVNSEQVEKVLPKGISSDNIDIPLVEVDKSIFNSRKTSTESMAECYGKTGYNSEPASVKIGCAGFASMLRQSQSQH